MKLYVLIFLILASCTTPDPLLGKLKEHNNLAMHIHPSIEIDILGQQQSIPGSIGIDNEGMSYMHTHDDSGEIHIEAPYYHQFKLKDFFAIWGENFNATCIFDHCEDENHTLLVYVNGALAPEGEELLLYDNDKVIIVYSEN